MTPARSLVDRRVADATRDDASASPPATRARRRAETAEDIGFIFGRIHSSGTVAARELTAEIEWNVVGNGSADVSENELEIWYRPARSLRSPVKPPGGDWRS